MVAGQSRPAHAQEGAPPAASEAAVLDLGVDLPAAPDSVTVSDIPNDGGQALRIAWRAPAGSAPIGFAVLRAESEQGPFVPIDTVEAGTASFEDRALPGRPRLRGARAGTRDRSVDRERLSRW